MLIPFAILYALAGILLRLAPHAPNFAPIGALALWSGYYLPKRASVFVPLATLLVSDMIIGFYDTRVMLSVYVSFALIALIGRVARAYQSFPATLLGSLAGSTMFYLATNFAVWTESHWYARTWDGLMWCYALALPFFRNTLYSDVIYTAIFFGVYALARYFSSASVRVTSAPISGSAD
jgi:hypothetical protein